MSMIDAPEPVGKPRWFWVVIVVAAVLAGVVVTVVVVQATQQDREQRFLTALRSDTTATRIADLPDEQLLVSMRQSCEEIARGWTEDDAIAAAIRNWEAVSGASDITEEQYLANISAIHRAGVQACG